MKQVILAGKQVGRLSYMVESVERLILILKSQRILASRKFEYNKSTDRKMRYVSLSRNLTAAAKRNPGRWNVGVILDGDKLSDRYAIVPYSYVNSNLESGTNLTVKQITEYDNGTYKLNLVNWPAIWINKRVYNKIADIIEALPEKFKIEHKLVHSGEGKRRVNGALIVEKYLFNVPHGGPKLDKELLGDAIADFSKHSAMNETEERIWLDSGNFIEIAGCIAGVILPKVFEGVEPSESVLDELDSVMSELGLDESDIKTY